MSNRTPSDTTGIRASARPRSSRLATTFSALGADPRYAWTTRRRNRLLLVATQATLLVVALVLLVSDRPIWALVTFLTFFPLMSLINVGIHGLMEIPVAFLDDIMVRVRTEAAARAYRILVVLVGLVAGLAPVGAAFVGQRFAGDPRGAIVGTSGVLVGLFVVALLLPRWILAWQLPDRVAADPDTLPTTPRPRPGGGDDSGRAETGEHPRPDHG